MSSKWESDEEIQRFREYLKIPSVHPNIDYGDCITFLKKQAMALGLPFEVYELVPKKPVLVVTWKGYQPELPAILLNSHMDVVPVYEEYWTYPPFEAHITEDGFINARGTQDMKSVGMCHLEAIRRLKKAGVTLKRTVHVSFVPDEEINSVDGMRVFAASDVFKKLNIGFGMDESSPSTNDKVLNAYNGERTSRQMIIHCRSQPGHGSYLVANTAGEKLHYIMDKFMKLRSEEKKKYDAGVELGDVTTINLTQLQGGVQVNVLPECLSATFDIRIPPHVNHDEFENMVLKWCKEAGENVTMEYVVKNPEVKSTKINNSNQFWVAIRDAVSEMGMSIKCVTCPGGTDARFVRLQGIPVISLSPLLNTPLLLHAHNERLHVDEFKRGIDIMQNILKAIANV